MLSLQIAHLSSHILYNTVIHRILNFTSQASFLCFLKIQVLNDFGKTPCQRFLLPNFCRSKFMFREISGTGVNSVCNMDSRSKRGVVSSSINKRTSCYKCTNRYLLKCMNKLYLQSITCRVSTSGSIKQNLQIEEDHNL